MKVGTKLVKVVSVPSPKVQSQVVNVPPLAELRSVNEMACPEHPGVLLEKAAMGAGITVTDFVFVLVHPAVSVSTSVTVYMPEVE